MALLLIVAIGLIFCGFGAFVAMIISVVNDANDNPVLLVAAGLAIGAGVILYFIVTGFHN